MNDAEIADRLTGTKCIGATLTKSTSLNDVWLTFRQRDSFIVLEPSDYLAHCRAVLVPCEVAAEIQEAVCGVVASRSRGRRGMWRNIKHG